jgi:hypothetical protein
VIGILRGPALPNMVVDGLSAEVLFARISHGFLPITVANCTTLCSRGLQGVLPNPKIMADPFPD